MRTVICKPTHYKIQLKRVQQQENYKMAIKKGSTKQSDFVKGCEFVLSGVKVLWANVQADNPDSKYERVWKTDVILEKSMADSMLASGFGVREKDGEYLLTIKKKCMTRDGKAQTPPTVVGRDGKTPFTEEIGNGSTCNIKVYAKYCEVKGETHLPAYLNALQVVEHVARGAGFDNLDGTEEAPF